MFDKRLTDRLLQYWERLRKDKPLPPMEAFNSGAVQDIWDYCIKITMQSNPPSYNFYFDFIGNEVKNIMGGTSVGTVLGVKSLNNRHAPFLNKLADIINEPKALMDEGKFIGTQSKMIKYRACILPFGTSAENVTHFIIGVSWRIF